MEKFENIEVLKKLGNQIRLVRKRKKLTLDDVSVHSGIDTSDIGKIERGEINLAFTTLYRIAKGLDMKLSLLLDYVE